MIVDDGVAVAAYASRNRSADRSAEKNSDALPLSVDPLMLNRSQMKPPDTNPYPVWAPRFWHGMLFTDWLRLLSQHRFRVHPLRWGLATGVTVATSFNSKMRLAQVALMGHQIKKTEVPSDPIFIIGHWRSGTTLLHELLSVDDRFASPTTYQCFAANHFLLTEPYVTRLLWFMIPGRRPMDNVTAGWHEPQEDEFALCAMGIPSPYLRMAFPNEADEHLNYLDMEHLAPHELDVWKSALSEFLRQLTVRHGKRLVLKSPTHTGRVRLLAEMFPNAKFIHIVRDPYDVVPSTLRLWRSLDYVQGLQLPNREDMEDYIHRAYERMYGGLHRSRGDIGDDRIIDIRYEELVNDACGVLRRTYEQLDLGDFDLVCDAMQATVEVKKNYKKNAHQLDADLVANINERWQEYFARYGYPIRETE